MLPSPLPLTGRLHGAPQLCRMYDFCLTPIYAFLLALGGLAGYLTKGSTASLGGREWAGGEVWCVSCRALCSVLNVEGSIRFWWLELAKLECIQTVF